MYAGGQTINDRTAQIIRLSGLLIPVVLLLYGFLIQYNVVASTHYINDSVFYAIMLPWLSIALLQYFNTSKSADSSAFRLISYHLFAAAYIILVSGFTMPFTVGWVVLFLASYSYFSHTGLRLSVGALIITAFIDLPLHIHQESIMVSNALAMLAVLLVGLTAIAISKVQEVDAVELSRSKALENLQRDRILTIVNNLADAVLSTDKDGIIRVYNAASLNLLDTNNSLNGHYIDEILTFRDQNKDTISAFDLLKSTQSVTVRDDLTMVIAEETLRLEVTFSPIRGGYTKVKKSNAHDGYILILRDITKTKSLEEERDEFISVVSHELRTPITIAEGTISNVQVMMDRPEISEDILRKGIDTAHDQVIFLAKMVNDLSTLSRAERGVADEAEVIDVRGLVDDLFNEYAPQAAAKNLHFNLDLSPHLGELTASSLYLRELLQNFITNSIKYTKEGDVTLKITRDKNTVTFEVKDTGIGISKTDQAKIFNKFYRSEDYRTRETGGTGLGLYVAVKLSKKLGADIKLRSRLNHGSSFSFSLPATDKKPRKNK